MHRLLILGAVAIAALSLPFTLACGDDGGAEPTATSGGATQPSGTEPSATTSGEATTIDVTLREFSVTPSEASAPAGAISFNVENAGAEEHEFLVARLASAGGELPTKDDGSVDEDQADVIDEIGEDQLQPGDTATLDVNLTAGSYVLFCNIVETTTAGETESHYDKGMHSDFTVE
jgi:uncharacterized cupredoxin-like copper-binding protein